MVEFQPAIGDPAPGSPGPLDALLPAEMAAKAEAVGVRKATLPWLTTFVLAVLAGAFISLGAMFATTVVAGAGDRLPFGVARLLAGVVFSLGLILVVVAGAELFTGNNLIVMAWAGRRVSSRQLISNWALVYLGNLVGALATAGIVFLARQYEFGRGSVGEAVLATAQTKSSLGFVQAVALGVLCNALVCLAVWLCFSARTTTDKVLSIIFPISAFVAAGFEHSVANMYFIPMGLFVKSGAGDGFWREAGVTVDGYPDVTWGSFVVDNLVPVTIGNTIGGALLVGLVYWFVYLRRADGAGSA